FLDPVSIGLEDPAGDTIDYDLGSGTLTDTTTTTFVDVVGNIEVVVVLAAPDDAGDVALQVDDVSAGARGGVVVLGPEDSEVIALTHGLSDGRTEFDFTIPEG